MFRYEVIQSLNNLELSLYEYIMKNSKKVIYMRIRELAEEAHVSTTTILRFCKKLNCEGFSEFKIKFKNSIPYDNLIKMLSKYTIDNILIEEATLEDIFLHFYK